jgi:hypothetical protein
LHRVLPEALPADAKGVEGVGHEEPRRVTHPRHKHRQGRCLRPLLERGERGQKVMVVLLVVVVVRRR